jgi:hypothetical protein
VDHDVLCFVIKTDPNDRIQVCSSRGIVCDDFEIGPSFYLQQPVWFDPAMYSVIQTIPTEYDQNSMFSLLLNFSRLARGEPVDLVTAEDFGLKLQGRDDADCVNSWRNDVISDYLQMINVDVFSSEDNRQKLIQFLSDENLTKLIDCPETLSILQDFVQKKALSLISGDSTNETSPESLVTFLSMASNMPNSLMAVVDTSFQPYVTIRDKVVQVYTLLFKMEPVVREFLASGSNFSSISLFGLYLMPESSRISPHEETKKEVCSSVFFILRTSHQFTSVRVFPVTQTFFVYAF